MMTRFCTELFVPGGGAPTRTAAGSGPSASPIRSSSPGSEIKSAFSVGSINRIAAGLLAVPNHGGWGKGRPPRPFQGCAAPRPARRQEKSRAAADPQGRLWSRSRAEPLSRRAVRARPRPQRHSSQWAAPQGGAKQGRRTRMFVESGRGAAGRGAGLGGECGAARCGAGGQRSALVFLSARAALRVRELRGPASVGSTGPEAREASGPPFWVSGSSGTGRSGRSGAPRRRFRSRCAGGGRRFRPCPLPRDRRGQRSVPVLRPAGAVPPVPGCAAARGSAVLWALNFLMPPLFQPRPVRGPAVTRGRCSARDARKCFCWCSHSWARRSFPTWKLRS